MSDCCCCCFAVAIDALTVFVIAAAVTVAATTEAVSTWAYDNAPLEICYFESRKMAKSKPQYIRRIECVCVFLFVFVAHYLPFHSTSRSFFFSLFRYISVLVSAISNTIANAHETHRVRTRAKKTPCIPASQSCKKTSKNKLFLCQISSLYKHICLLDGIEAAK